VFITQTPQRHWTQDSSNSRPDLRPDAEKRLDAGVIRSASKPANLHPNAEEILDAGIIKSASRPAGSAFCEPRLMKKFLSAWTRVRHFGGAKRKELSTLTFPSPQPPEVKEDNSLPSAPQISKFCLDSGARFVKSAPDDTERGTERKDQIRVLQTKSASKPFTIRNILSEGSELQDLAAPGHQTRASVINPKTASGNQTRFIFCVKGS
jgi:hypothetical protein